MLAIQENKISMYFKVQTFLNQQGASLSTAIPALAQKITEFKDLLVVIGDTVGQASESNQGYTLQKRTYRDTMRNRMLEASGALRSYALTNNDLVLAEKANYNKSTLDNMRDTELLFMATRLHSLLIENQSELDNFGYSAPQIGQYKDNLDVLTNFLQTPSEQRGSTKAANQQLVSMMEQTDKMLDIIDNMMETQRFTSAQIYNQYRADRLIDDNASGQSDPVAMESIAPGEVKMIFKAAYLPNRRFRIKNDGDTMLQWGLSTTEMEFSNRIYEVEAKASSTRLSSAMDAEGDMVLVKNIGEQEAVVSLFEEEL